jgi:hypothetical protein
METFDEFVHLARGRKRGLIEYIQALLSSVGLCQGGRYRGIGGNDGAARIPKRPVVAPDLAVTAGRSYADGGYPASPMNCNTGEG